MTTFPVSFFARLAHPAMPLSLLVVDDDRRLQALLSEYLAENDVLTESAHDGPSGLLALARGSFDAVILDIMMPGPSGLEVLRKVRESSAVPVIMLTAKGDETDRVVGLELGADDYLAKPFSPRELLARVRAVLRRGKAAELGGFARFGDVEIDRTRRQVKVGGSPVDLTALEFDLLAVLVDRPGRVIGRTTLWELAGRGDTTVSERALDVHISHLRKKLREDERESRLIVTVRGVGYMLAAGP
jgi:DNA-binding response OmpR family regulator